MNDIQTATVDLLWSLWTELGVPGSGRRHSHLLADPEPLIIFTPQLAAHDPRLLGLAFDWCVAHGDLLSKPRITALLRNAPEDVAQAFLPFSGSLGKHNIHWTSSDMVGPFERERNAMALPLERPSLLRLRIRSLVGVSARAEILTELIATPHNTLSAAELTASGTTRRSTDRILTELIQGQFLTVHGKQRGRTFSLANRHGFLALLGQEDITSRSQSMDWLTLLQGIVEMGPLQSLTDPSPAIRQVEAAKVRNRLAPIMNSLHNAAPPHLAGRENAHGLLHEWCTHLVNEWAKGNI